MTNSVLNILMIDDSLSQYELVRDFLQVASTPATQYIVEWESTFEGGVKALDSKTFDVCLVDYELENANGLDIIQQVASKRNSIPMILLTGHGSYDVDLEAMHAGAVDYLDKTSLKPNVLERSIRYATENQRMLDRERKQRAITEALLDTALALNSSLEMDDVLERILTNMQRVLPHDSSDILLIKDEKAIIVGSFGYTTEKLEQTDEFLQTYISEIPTLNTMMVTMNPLIINNVSQSAEWVIVDGTQFIGSYLGVPIVIHDEVIGFLNFDCTEANQFTEEHAHYAQIFAQQAAQAIRNTRAFKQAQILAATQERQRLARDLHDAVSQTLFSASVIAQTLPRLIAQKPDEVNKGLQDLNRLNRGALAEMRTLLVELRPQSLVETELPALLRNLNHAFTSRAEVEVEARIFYDETLPDDVHIAFYRIAQEALNNVQKYAQASQVIMELVQEGCCLMLRIKDDGVGFAVDKVQSGHLGLKIMEERASSIDATLNIESTIGAGTSIELIWDMKGKAKLNDQKQKNSCNDC